MTAALSPRPHQVDALADLMNAFVLHDRVQLIMACGTGKTLIGRWHAEASECRQVLVLVPSLALLAQTLGEWRRVRTSWSFEALIVCSDPTTPAGAAERARIGEDLVDRGTEALEPDWARVRAKVTTDPSVAARFLERREENRPQVVFSTYHSAPVVEAAQARTGVTFDLAICDEAHHLAGAPRHDFRAALDARRIRSRRRLFMTATQRISAGLDTYTMDDPKTFGVVAHTVTFGDAIKAGLLTDYQVLVVAGRHGDRAKTADGAHVPASVLFDAIDQFDVRRVLSFHNRINKAQGFAQLLNGARTPAGLPVRARSVSGNTPAGQRAAILRWLAAPGAGARVVTNARVLAEGVDVPAVDGICFVDERSSVVEIIQAIGRVLRPAPGKRIGTIIVPVALPADADDDTELLMSSFGTLWNVLRGLRAHDQRFDRDIVRAVRAHVRNGRLGFRPTQVHYLLPDDIDLEDQIHLRLVREVGDQWQHYCALVEDWAFQHPGQRLGRATKWRDAGIGEWAAKQRAAYHRGLLPADRVRRLEQLHGWYWDRADAVWDDTYEIVQRHVAQTGTIADADIGPSVFAKMYTAPGPRERLGLWLARQRQAYRDGALVTDRARRLEQLPGWTWAPMSQADLAMVEALRQFVEFEKHADVPRQHLEDGLELGRWVRDIRRRKLTGRLAPALEDEIWAATPTAWGRGTRIRWQWDAAETAWALAYTALLQYVQREDSALVPPRHEEQLPDTTIRLGQWVSRQRLERRRGRLTAAQIDALQRMPGWQWSGRGNAIAPQVPIELPPHLEHGSAGAIGRGCCCSVCLAKRRATQNASTARRRAVVQGGSVDASAARRHLSELERRLAAAYNPNGADSTVARGRRLIAAVSGVPMGVLRGIAGGELTHIKPEHAAAVRATTAEMCLRNLSASGSRGRPKARLLDLVDSAPTRRILADLADRGFSVAWIGRELGYANPLQLNGATISRLLATQIRDLAERIGDLQMPPLARTQPRPTLADLHAMHTKVA